MAGWSGSIPKVTILPDFRLWPCQRDRFMEGGDVADVMIAGTNQQNFVLVGQHCRQRDCGGTIALHRLEQDTRSCPRYGTKLRLLCLVGDDDRRREGVAEPFERLLEQVLLADQRKKMLRPLRGGQGPQPSPGAAGQYDWTDRPSPFDFAHGGLHAENNRRTPAFTISL